MAVDNRLTELWQQLQDRHGVHAGYYQIVNLEDLPRGPFTEIGNICSQLEETGLPCTPENVYTMMKARKELLEVIAGSDKLRARVNEASKGKVGFAGEPLLDFAILLIPFVLFGKGFFTRLGERLADHIFDYLTRKRGVPSEEAESLAEATVELDYDSRKGLLKYRRRDIWKR